VRSNERRRFGYPLTGRWFQAITCRSTGSLEFVSDAFTGGRRSRILNVMYDFIREHLALVADASLSGLCVTRDLDRVIAERGVPEKIVSDNGTEFTGMAIPHWAQKTGIDWHCIAPEKLTQNSFIEIFIGKLLPLGECSHSPGGI